MREQETLELHKQVHYLFCSISKKQLPPLKLFDIIFKVNSTLYLYCVAIKLIRSSINEILHSTTKLKPSNTGLL